MAHKVIHSMKCRKEKDKSSIYTYVLASLCFAIALPMLINFNNQMNLKSIYLTRFPQVAEESVF